MDDDPNVIESEPTEPVVIVKGTLPARHGLSRGATALIALAFFVCAASAIIGVFLVNSVSERADRDAQRQIQRVEELAMQNQDLLTQIQSERAERIEQSCRREVTAQQRRRAMHLREYDRLDLLNPNAAPFTDGLRSDLDILIPLLGCNADWEPTPLSEIPPGELRYPVEDLRIEDVLPNP